MPEPILLTFPRRRKAAEVSLRYFVVNRADPFVGMSCWPSLEQAEVAAGDMATEYPGDEIAILAPVAVWQDRGGALRRRT
jgi:hypothetical protein